MKVIKQEEKNYIIRDVFPRLVAMSLIIVVAITLLINGLTMVITTCQLFANSVERKHIIHVAESSPSGWSPKNEEGYNKLVDECNALINSPNPVVSNFASGNALDRTLQFIGSVLGLVVCIYAGYWIFLHIMFDVSNIMQIIQKKEP